MDDPGLQALWNAVEERWDDDKVHLAFLEYCTSTDRLAEAARLYRGAATGDREPQARKRLGEIVVRAHLKLGSPQPTGAFDKVRIWLLVLAGGALLAVLLLMLRMILQIYRR